MKSLVLFDSQYGNTKQIAETIARALGSSGDAKAIEVNKATLSDFSSLDLLVVGSPTQGGRPTQALQTLLNGLPARSLHNVRVAAFDTRMSPEGRGWFLRTLMRVIDFAAPKITKVLRQKGGTLAAEPEGFIVGDREGPLKKGELERAKQWAERL